MKQGLNKVSIVLSDDTNSASVFIANNWLTWFNRILVLFENKVTIVSNMFYSYDYVVIDQLTKSEMIFGTYTIIKLGKPYSVLSITIIDSKVYEETFNYI